MKTRGDWEVGLGLAFAPGTILALASDMNFSLFLLLIYKTEKKKKKKEQILLYVKRVEFSSDYTFF